LADHIASDPGAAHLARRLSADLYDDEIFPGGDNHDDTLVRADFRAIPVPAAAWLFNSGLLRLIGIART